MSKEYILVVDDWGAMDEDGNVCISSHLTGEEIVRCGNCKYFSPDGIYSAPNKTCYLSEGNPNCYCWQGEKKD